MELAHEHKKFCTEKLYRHYIENVLEKKQKNMDKSKKHCERCNFFVSHVCVSPCVHSTLNWLDLK